MTSFIRSWNYPGACFNPKGMTVNSYCPKGVMNAVSGIDPGCISIYQYPRAKSNVVNHLAPVKQSNISATFGKGYKKSSVALLIWR
jgi:hypothetical protein